MSNIISILVLIPGKKNGECDMRYRPALQEFENKSTVPLSVIYVDIKLLSEPAISFLYRKKVAYTHSGYMKFDDITYHVSKVSGDNRSKL